MPNNHLLTGFLDRGSYHLYYEDYNAEGMPVLLIYGGTSSSLSFKTPLLWDLAGWLRALGCRLILFDLQGFEGASHLAKFNADYFQANADDAAELLRFLQVDQAVIIGVSDGAIVSLNVAIRHPELVRACIADSGSCRITKEVALASEVSKTVSEDSWYRYLMKIHGREHIPQLQQAYAELVNSLADQGTDLYQGKLPQISSPVLLLSCEGDFFKLADQNREMAQLIPNVNLKIFEGGNHPVVWTLKEDFMKVVGEFIKPFKD